MKLDSNRSYPSQEEITRHRIMDACVDGLALHSLAGLRVKHIIELSGLSKQTIYNHFKNRDEILVAVFTREGARLCEACAREIRRYASVEDKFVYGLLFIHDQLPLNPVLNQIVSNHHEFLETLQLEVIPLEQFGRLCFEEVLEEHPFLADDFGEIADYWSRSVLSLLLFGAEPGRGREELKAYTRRRLVPGLALDRDPLCR